MRENKYYWVGCLLFQVSVDVKLSKTKTLRAWFSKTLSTKIWKFNRNHKPEVHFLKKYKKVSVRVRGCSCTLWHWKKFIKLVHIVLNISSRTQMKRWKAKADAIFIQICENHRLKMRPTVETMTFWWSCLVSIVTTERFRKVALTIQKRNLFTGKLFCLLFKLLHNKSSEPMHKIHEAGGWRSMKKYWELRNKTDLFFQDWWGLEPKHTRFTFF